MWRVALHRPGDLVFFTTPSQKGVTLSEEKALGKGCLPDVDDVEGNVQALKEVVGKWTEVSDRGVFTALDSRCTFMLSLLLSLNLSL